MSSWQDWTIFIGQLVLAATLVPTITGKVRMPLLTAIPATLVLAVFALTFATLGLAISAASSVLNTVAWAVITLNSLRTNDA